VRAPAGYPRGLIDILPAVEGGISGIFPHQSRGEAPAGAPYRLEKICVATDSENNLRRDAQAEPRSAEDRLAWHVRRALDWIEHASNGTLLASGDPFELPIYPQKGSGLFVFREGAGDLGRWGGVADTAGMANLRLLDVGRGPTWVISAFLSLRGQVLFDPPWGTGITSRWSQALTAFWIRVPDVVVRPPYTAPSTWGEMADALADQHVDLYAELKRVTARSHDGARHPLLVGFPVPKVVGDAPHQFQWLAVDLPSLAGRAPNGFRQNDLGLWVATAGTTFGRNAQVPWAASQNWHPDELATRGRLEAPLTQARVVLIGAGALGSAVAELLIRGGVVSLTVVDGDEMGVGNLVRHTLTLDDLNGSKAEALARRLNAAAPSARVVAQPVRLETLLDAAFLADFDLVIEATGDHAVLELLTGVEALHQIVYASLAVTLHARHLVAHLSRGTRFPLDHFDEAYAPLRAAELERDEERPWEGVGCWHPVFPVRADQVWMMAAAAIELLNESWPIASGGGALHVIERTADNVGNFTGMRKVSP
jgi:ThiF family